MSFPSISMKSRYSGVVANTDATFGRYTPSARVTTAGRGELIEHDILRKLEHTVKAPPRAEHIPLPSFKSYDENRPRDPLSVRAPLAKNIPLPRFMKDAVVVQNQISFM